MDVRYKPEEWQDMKEGIDKITKEAIPKLKEMNRTLEDVEAKIRELDSDRSINFSHTNQEKKLHDLLDDYIELGNYCTKVGEVVSRHFDKPFLEDMDAFAGKIRDLSIKNYKTDNRIGATTTTTTPSVHGYGQVQTITTKKDEITVDDIFKESVAFEKVLKAQYKEMKKQNPDAELSYEQYRDFVPSMRGFEYETIAEGQKKLESWRDLAIAGALIILTIAVPPVGITASVAYGGLQLKSAIEGKDWGTGRELTAAERAENGVFGVIDAIPVIGVAGKAFRATESLVTLHKLSKIKDVPGVKFTANKVSDVVQLLQNNKNTWLRDLKLKGLKAADKINDWDHAIKGGAAKIIDGTTGGLHIAKDFVSVKSLVPADGAMQLRRGTDLESRVKASHAESKADIQSRISKLEQEGRLSTKGTGDDNTYRHLKDYESNTYFTRSVEYNAGKEGTGFTYKVYQRGDIDWNMVRTKGAKKGRGLTNAEAASKYGLAPILDDAGSVATLHHSQQKGVGPLFEASTRYHNISNAKRPPLHPYKGKLNPFYPMDEPTRKAFQKVDSINYWKTRGNEALGGN
ncbi:hypothetical protein [Bacillus manliponensis]|uniref:hypothetical protein n=1 Tax=Bacillus manliponensis TaxID=574376 RepID=UPI003519437F